MARPLATSDVDDINREIHKRNKISSDNFLKLLKKNHGIKSDEEPPPLPPIPDEAIAEACELAVELVDIPVRPRLIHGPIRTIQIAILREFPGITMMDLFARRRERVVVHPRQIGMYLAKMLTENSLPEIGRRFGGRDHATVLHAIKKISRDIQHKPDLAAQIDRIRQSLTLEIPA